VILSVGSLGGDVRIRAPVARERSTDGDEPWSPSPPCHRSHIPHAPAPAPAPISPHDAAPVSPHAAARQKKKIGSRSVTVTRRRRRGRRGWRSPKPTRQTRVCGEDEEGGVEIIGADEASGATTTNEQIRTRNRMLLGAALPSHPTAMGSGTDPAAVCASAPGTCWRW
jgi:hypothetical protein